MLEGFQGEEGEENCTCWENAKLEESHEAVVTSDRRKINGGGNWGTEDRCGRETSLYAFLYFFDL